MKGVTYTIKSLDVWKNNSKLILFFPLYTFYKLNRVLIFFFFLSETLNMTSKTQKDKDS